jgi:hypothetical protein
LDRKHNEQPTTTTTTTTTTTSSSAIKVSTTTSDDILNSSVDADNEATGADLNAFLKQNQQDAEAQAKSKKKKNDNLDEEDPDDLKLPTSSNLANTNVLTPTKPKSSLKVSFSVSIAFLLFCSQPLVCSYSRTARPLVVAVRTKNAPVAFVPARQQPNRVRKLGQLILVAQPLSPAATIPIQGSPQHRSLPPLVMASLRLEAQKLHQLMPTKTRARTNETLSNPTHQPMLLSQTRR